MRLFGIGKKSGGAATKSVVSQRRSFVYISLWDYRYEFKTRYLGKILAAFFFLLTAIELIGPVTHLLPEQKEPLIHFGIAGLLFTTAVLIIWHHHRADVRTERYQGLLNSVMVQHEQLATTKTPFTLADTIRVLDSLVETVGHRRGALFSASILKRVVNAGEPFKIYVQDKQNKFQTEFAVDETNSVAGKVVLTDKTTPRALMYVPSTKFIHGAVITWAKAPSGSQIFVQREIVTSAYSDVTSSLDHDVQKSLLCITIPLQQIGKKPADPDISAVLCLSGRKKDCMGALDFTALKVFAALLSEVMKNYP